MKHLRLIILVLLPVVAGSFAFAQGALWGDRGYSAEFKYFLERGTFTPETWDALSPEAQERALADARRPAAKRRGEINDYWADAAKKWDSAALKKYAEQKQDANLRAVSIWLGQE